MFFFSIFSLKIVALFVSKTCFLFISGKHFWECGRQSPKIDSTKSISAKVATFNFARISKVMLLFIDIKNE